MCVCVCASVWQRAKHGNTSAKWQDVTEVCNVEGSLLVHNQTYLYILHSLSRGCWPRDLSMSFVASVRQCDPSDDIQFIQNICALFYLVHEIHPCEFLEVVRVSGSTLFPFKLFSSVLPSWYREFHIRNPFSRSLTDLGEFRKRRETLYCFPYFWRPRRGRAL